jgi:hypothetical protein
MRGVTISLYLGVRALITEYDGEIRFCFVDFMNAVL